MTQLMSLYIFIKRYIKCLGLNNIHIIYVLIFKLSVQVREKNHKGSSYQSICLLIYHPFVSTFYHLYNFHIHMYGYENIIPYNVLQFTNCSKTFLKILSIRKVNAWASVSVVMSLRILTSQRFFSLTTTESSDLSSVSSHCSDQFGVQDQEGKIQVYWKVLSVRLHRKGIL